MIKRYFTPVADSKSYGAASMQTILDGIKFSSEIGFEPIILGERKNKLRYYTRILKFWRKTDVVLAMYPYICPPEVTNNHFRTLESSLINKMNKNRFSILYIVDLPIEQRLATTGDTYAMDRKAYEIERKIFESFDMLCVFNEYMKRAIQQKYKIQSNKFIEFEILDYGVKFNPAKTEDLPEYKYKVVYGGSDKDYISSWMKDVPKVKNIEYEFFGSNGGWINDFGRQDIIYKEFLPTIDFVKYISTNAHFGIIARNFKNNYYNFTSTSKFSAYLVAGLPILVPSQYTYISSLVKKYEVGFCFSSFTEIPQIIDDLTQPRYNKIRSNCLKLGEKIQNGYFFKKAVGEALKNSSISKRYLSPH